MLLVNMSEISIKEVYNELKNIEKKMVTKEDIEKFIDTIEVLNNHETMKQIVESSKDIKNGRVKEINSVNDLISEL